VNGKFTHFVTKGVRMNKCGNKHCRVSTGIHGGLTFGSGELNSNGCWEFPCPICAKKVLEVIPHSNADKWTLKNHYRFCQYIEEKIIDGLLLRRDADKLIEESYSTVSRKTIAVG